MENNYGKKIANESQKVLQSKNQHKPDCWKLGFWWLETYLPSVEVWSQLEKATFFVKFNWQQRQYFFYSFNPKEILPKFRQNGLWFNIRWFDEIFVEKMVRMNLRNFHCHFLSQKFRENNLIFHSKNFTWFDETNWNYWFSHFYEL